MKIKNNIANKFFIFGIVIIFVGTTFSQCTANSSLGNQSQRASNGNILYVGGS